MVNDRIVTAMFDRFPDLTGHYQQLDPEWRRGDEGSPYIAMGAVFLPAVDSALETRDLRNIVTMCAFLEDVAERAQSDRWLAILLKIEVGRWLGWVANEDALTPWLGAETKRICGYVPGLATQRRQLKAEREQQRWHRKLFEWLKRLFHR